MKAYSGHSPLSPSTPESGHLPDCTHQSRQGEGFRKEPNSLFQHAVMCDRIMARPGDIEDLCMGRDFQDLLSQLAAIHRRHDYIRDHQPDSSVILSASAEPSSGLFAISSPQSSNFWGVAWVRQRLRKARPSTAFHFGDSTTFPGRVCLASSSCSQPITFVASRLPTICRLPLANRCGLA
jgi:hypothetical protein